MNKPSFAARLSTTMLALIAALSITACSPGDRSAKAPAQSSIAASLAEIGTLQEDGKLAEADALASQLLEKKDKLSPSEVRQLEYEIERARRIRLDYTVTEEKLISILTERIRDFRKEELAAWETEGRVDSKVIDGQKMYVGATASNLFFRHADIRARRIKPVDFEWEDFLFKHARQVKSEVTQGAQGTATPRHFNIKMTITVKKDVVPAGQTIRCWMPFPQQFQAQSGIALISSNPTPKWVNAPNYPVRSLYFEQASRGAEPTVFESAYTLTTQPRYFQIDPALVGAADQNANPYAAYFTREQLPHVALTPQIRQLAASIVGQEENPAAKARLLYDYVCDNFVYSYAREYSTLRCISQYVLDNGYGDCGQIALLYITLCRAEGIPARWQSGWLIYPQWENLHDWSEIYLEPYGWVPVDPNFGMDISNGFENLSDAEREELRLFYFGGIDAYRIAVNSEHGYPHYPAKVDFRSDDVDFQRGELESEGKNIYFTDFSYNLDADEVGASAGQTDKAPAAGMLYPGAAR